jgi:carbon storage regulator
MLVLSRVVGELISIGDDISMRVCRSTVQQRALWRRGAAKGQCASRQRVYDRIKRKQATEKAR